MGQQADRHIPWEDIETILLDMDGTLLDLYFDNYFWNEYLPLKWAELQGIELADAKSHLLPKINDKMGTLTWYCLDHWSEELGIDILTLKADIQHLIDIRPSAEAFLRYVAGLEQPVIMVTNSHEGLIGMKMDKTGIDKYFDKIISSHQLGVAKEEVFFWEKLKEEFHYDPYTTLLIDDNLHVLRSAQRYGIEHLWTISQPDSKAPVRDIEEFPVIASYDDVYHSPLA